MALEKEFEVSNSGIIANYLRLERLDFHRTKDLETPYIRVECGLYKNKEARDTGKTPISMVTIDITEEKEIAAIVETYYNKMKSLPEFEGAVDV